MRHRTNLHPRLESLESLALLSGGGAAMVQHPHAAEVFRDASVQLGGTESGTFFASRNSVATTYSLFAAGRLSSVGLGSTTGKLRVLNGISSGPPSGSLRITAARGSLKLQIPESVMLPAGLPTPTSPQQIVDTYVITGGTGAYRGDSGSGVVEFTFHGIGGAAFGYRAGQVNITFATLASPS